MVKSKFYDKKQQHYRKKKFRISWTFLKYFLMACIAIITIYMVTDMIHNFFTPDPEPPRYAEGYDGVIRESEYIISKHMVLSELQQEAQIVSYEQDLFKVESHYDKGLFGTRETELTMRGSYKMGLNTEDIIVKHIDSKAGAVFIELPKPEVISLEVPYDQIEFDKESGWLRLAMNEEEEKNFYRSAVNNIRYELNNDFDVLKTADLYNREVVKEMLTKLTDIKNVIFEDGEWKTTLQNNANVELELESGGK